MSEEPASIELTVPAAEVEAAVARVCADWGVDPAAVQVDRLPPDQAGLVWVRVTALDVPGVEVAAERDAPAQAPAAGAGPAPAEAAAAGEADPTLDRARQVLSELLEKMGIQADVRAEWGQETDGVRPVVLDVYGDDLSMLIGRKGDTLAALQYITRLILSKQLGEGIELTVDVQGHKRRREDQLRRMARRMAEQVAQRGRVMSLEPMPPHERRIIHLELRDHPEVRTESIGEGSHRKVTIVPKLR